MYILKMKSGNYRVRKMIDGVTYSATFDHYPDFDEIINSLRPPGKKRTKKDDKNSFKHFAEEYIALKEPVLSVTTISAYESMLRNVSDSFKKKDLFKITNIDIQKEINIYSAKHSPKSTYNLHGFIHSILGLFRPDMHICTSLPRNTATEPYIPLTEDVKTILEYMKKNAPQYVLPISLACLGLRKSEIICITSDDLDDDDYLTISKAMVEDKNYTWRIKGTKTRAGIRKVKLPADVAEMLRKQGYAYSGHPDNINKYLVLAEEKLGLPHFTLHKFRHYYITTMHTLGIPDVYIARSCGHEDINTTRKVYTHAQNPTLDSFQQKTADYLAQNIFEDTESQNKISGKLLVFNNRLMEQTGVEPVSEISSILDFTGRKKK